MRNIRPGLALMLEDAFLQASLPLFEDGVVDALEWSFDVGWARPSLPEWVSALLDEYGGKGALVGHGVTYSALSGKGGERAEQWLEYLREELKVRRQQIRP